MSKVHQRTGSLNPGRSAFDLSYTKKLTCDMGQLIPVMCDEVVPGDVITIGNQCVVRAQPLVAPIMHEVSIFTHYFFVPYRIVDDDFEEFITKGVDGDQTLAPPRWTPPSGGYTSYSLWDYFGFPLDTDCTGATPLDYPKRAYNLVWNEYYRDQNLQTEVDITTSDDLLLRNWSKDYFTSSLPWQQRGTAPALPISGVINTQWLDSFFAGAGGTGSLNFSTTASDPVLRGLTGGPAQAQNAKDFFNSGEVDLSNASTFDVADLRLVFQIQKWMERNARAGVRYTEFLKAHFGVNPRDDRLQRPEYIGGSKSPLIVSEVLQTSSTDATTPQGNLAGHGMAANNGFVGKYRVQEYGCIIGIMSIMPKPAYQQGIDRQWLRRTTFDFYFPEFANLSEQAIENAEILATDSDTHNLGIFGYAGRFDEMRVKRNMVVAGMRDTFDYWHLGRIFDPANPPALNEAFIQCIPDKRVFAVQDEPGFIVNYANLIKAIRPLPIMSNPGMIDH